MVNSCGKMKQHPTWICILLYLTSLFHDGENRTINGKPLHYLMTKEEMKRYFGSENLSNVPEYDVTVPLESKDGTFSASFSLNHRLRRSEEGDDATYRYKIDALGEQLHLHVKRNTKFMAPNLMLETRDEKGQRVSRSLSRNAFMTGSVASDPDSVVALSVREGLTGMVRRSRDTFLIHPLPTRLARHFGDEEGAKPHLIFRRSSQENNGCQTNTETIPRERRARRSSERAGDVQDDDRNSKVTDKFLEVAILADESVVEVHGNNSEDYLLLLASIVDTEIFQDPTIGDQKINFVATRLILVNNTEFGVNSASGISHRSIIGKVGKWASENNRPDQSDPLQFDVAVLVRGGGNGGLASFGGVCARDNSVSVVRQNGLQTAFFIAHEVAHNLGVPHDSHGSSKNCPNYVNIMSETAQSGPGSWEWSSCSKEKLQSFLRSSRSTCLNDPPSSTRPKPPPYFYTDLPGDFLDADVQCKLQHGPEYRQCPQRRDVCSSLWCTPNGRECYSRFLRVADGTPCGLRHWCIKGSCVDNGSPIIDGGWSEWSNYTACSQTCRGGIRHRERTCTNPPPKNGGADCEGPTRSWETCNNNVLCIISDDQPSFRDQQCKNINSIYSAYYPANQNPCRLACRLGRPSYGFFGDVLDGTHCSENPYVYDVCIEGKCKTVGCDGILNSGKVKDRCGVCDGNGDSCTLVTSSYTKDYRKYWSPPDTIVVLPPKTSRAIFQQRNVKQYNVIGVQDEKGYVIPLVTWGEKTIYYAGTRIYYMNDYKSPDRLEIDGPTNLTLKIVYVHLQNPNVAVDYEYYRPLELNETPVPPTCQWVTTNWTDCSTGQQTRDVYCVRDDDFSPAGASCCGEDSKPDEIKLCFEWHFSNWQACTKTCGRGSQSRSVVCRARVTDTDYQIQSDEVCNAVPKPVETRFCNEINCPAYRTTHWTKCSTVCLPGERTNYTKCSRINALGESEEVSDIQCAHKGTAPPSVNETCNDDNPCLKHKIGCFKPPPEANLFSKTLGDFRAEAKTDPNQALMQCGELAHRDGYHVFALGLDGLCMSDADARNKYYKNKSPGSKRDAKKCSGEIGKGKFSVVYSFDPLPEYEPIGCFKDKKSDRAMKDNYASFRFFINWHNLNSTIRQCALVARDIGYEYFGVQFYGECWSSSNAAETYSKYNLQTDMKKCYMGVGAAFTNYVYRFKKMNEANSEPDNDSSSNTGNNNNSIIIAK
ncbi:A disintegrin and metalloproteinase with thrombospondin motifs 12-like isoform X2 [Stylophora pistillata]|uniref:A disintegrin and metalloproteinase with thrombospondin motifs 12-like isoform X2 n=1 Tax=Stylophora pistillata TaxID=50429 RepID=UPI000C0471ED|nr:A disintegrin and metalloproteinase with thrombospondin motifs 12-like isoform X2 [Stylophora pistillata]